MEMFSFIPGFEATLRFDEYMEQLVHTKTAVLCGSLRHTGGDMGGGAGGKTARESARAAIFIINGLF